MISSLQLSSGFSRHLSMSHIVGGSNLSLIRWHATHHFSLELLDIWFDGLQIHKAHLSRDLGVLGGSRRFSLLHCLFRSLLRVRWQVESTNGDRQLEPVRSLILLSVQLRRLSKLFRNESEVLLVGTSLVRGRPGCVSSFHHGTHLILLLV